MNLILPLCGKKSLAILILASLGILFFDLFSIAIIFPFLNLFIAPEVALNNPYSKAVMQIFGMKTASEFVYSAGFILIFLYILKLFLKTIFNALKNRTLADVSFGLSLKLYRGLLESRYSLFTEQSTSEMINVINAQTIHSVICVESLVKIFNELAFLVAAIGILFYYSPAVTLASILFFVILGTALYFGLVKKIEAFGKIHTRLNILVYKFCFAMANSIKDIKIMRLEDSFFEKFSKIWEEYSFNDSRSKTARGLPADIAETLIFNGIVLTCLFLLATNQSIKDAIPFLGVMAVTAMRVLPSFNRATSSYNEFRFYQSSLLKVKELLEKVSAYQQEIAHVILPFQKALEIRDVSFCFDDKKVLDSISLSLPRGGSFAFVGPSGAGKSTFLDVLVGLRQADAGNFFLDGIEFDPFFTDALRNYIGYVPQNVSLVDESIAFNIALDEKYDEMKMQKVISIAQLEKYVAELPLGLNTILGESGVRISGGQKQRIGIARALYRDPEILVFDEATSALDPITERDLMREIHKLSGEKTLIIVAHRLSTIENCSLIHLFDNGRIITRGNQAELMAASPEYKALYNKQDAVP